MGTQQIYSAPCSHLPRTTWSQNFSLVARRGKIWGPRKAPEAVNCISAIQRDTLNIWNSAKNLAKNWWKTIIKHFSSTTYSWDMARDSFLKNSEFWVFWSFFGFFKGPNHQIRPVFMKNRPRTTYGAIFTQIGAVEFPATLIISWTHS